MSLGFIHIVEGNVQMGINTAAASLLESWRLRLPDVAADGEVESKEDRLPEDVSLFIPLVDEQTNQPFLGFYNKPLMLPNPAVFHAILLPNMIEAETQQTLAQTTPSQKHTSPDGRV